MGEMAYRCLRPRNASAYAQVAGLNISDSFTMLRYATGDGRRSGVHDCMAEILDSWYVETGQVVVALTVGGAAFSGSGRRRYAAIAEWVEKEGITPPWTLLISMGNDVYRYSLSKERF